MHDNHSQPNKYAQSRVKRMRNALAELRTNRLHYPAVAACRLEVIFGAPSSLRAAKP